MDSSAFALNTWDEEGEAHLMLPVNDGCNGAEPDPESMYF